jgi:O-antigen/teichoic acid export membrane protein
VFNDESIINHSNKELKKRGLLELIKKFGPVAISDVISGILGSVFWFYLATMLTTNDYGEIQFFISIAGLGAGFALIANSNTITVFEIKKRGLTGILFLISLLAGAIVCLVLFIIYSRFDIVILTFGILSGEMIIGYFLGKKLFSKYAIMWISQKVLMLILGIGFYFIIGIEGIIYGIGISYSLFVIIILKNLKESTSDFSLIKKNYGFVINNYGTRLVVYARRNLDKIIIMPILGFEMLGVYALALQVYFIMMVFASISSKFLVFSNASRINSNKLKIILLALSIIFSLLGIFVAPEIIPILFPNFSDAIEIIPILSLAVIPNTVVIIYSAKFLGNEKSKFVLIGSIINAATYLVLLSIFSSVSSLVGVSISFLIGSILNAGFLVIMSKKYQTNTKQ